tara:strand:- start:275 stop:469 length:195 start_codon:yes stop_codon:yes gene_type:complete
MSKQLAKRKAQPEFLFVFNNSPQESSSLSSSVVPLKTIRASDFKADEGNSLRQALISELEEFGC